jgi:hypothetical protein
MSDPVAQNPCTCAHISHSRATVIKIALLRLNSPQFRHRSTSALSPSLSLPLALPRLTEGLVG